MDGDGLKEFLSLFQSRSGILVGGAFDQKGSCGGQLKFCLAFPDAYEVGMSHLGIQILYHILNGIKGVACERALPR
jgi:hypothetical protein